MLIHLSRRRRAGGSYSPPSLSSQLAAMLSGTAGFALDPTDQTCMWKLSNATDPVTAASDPVGCIRSKWGTTTRDIVQSNAGSQPLWNGLGGLFFDNSNDSLNFPLDYMQNIPAAFVCHRINPTSVGSDSTLFVSTGTSTSNHRFDQILSADGSYRFGGRRLDADSFKGASAVAGSIVAASSYIISHDIDYAGSGAIRGWINGSLVASEVLNGSPANTENTASLAATFGRLASTRFHGYLGKFVFCPFLPTAPQRAVIEAWVAEGAFV